MKPHRVRPTLGRWMILVAVTAGVLAGVRTDLEARRRVLSCRQSIKVIGRKLPDAADYRSRSDFHAASAASLRRVRDLDRADPGRADYLARLGWDEGRLRAWIGWHDGAAARSERAAAHPALACDPDPPMPGYE